MTTKKKSVPAIRKHSQKFWTNYDGLYVFCIQGNVTASNYLHSQNNLQLTMSMSRLHNLN